MLTCKTTDGVTVRIDTRVMEAFIAHRNKMYIIEIKSLSDLAMIENLSADAFMAIAKVTAVTQ